MDILAMEQGAWEAEALRRKRGIGGHDITALLGENPYSTPLDVWMKFMDMAPPFETNEHVERGKIMEPVAAATWAFRERATLLPGGFIRSSEHRFLVGAHDFEIVRWNGREDGVLEVKCPTSAGYSAQVRDGFRESTLTQLEWYCGIMGKTWGVALNFDAQSVKTDYVVLEANPERYDEMVALAVDFWHTYIIPRIPPTEWVPEVMPPAGTDVVHVNGEDAAIVRSYRSYKAQEKEAKENVAKIKDVLMERMPEAGARVFDAGDGCRVTFVDSVRKSTDWKRLQAEHPEVAELAKDYARATASRFIR